MGISFCFTKWLSLLYNWMPRLPWLQTNMDTMRNQKPPLGFPLQAFCYIHLTCFSTSSLHTASAMIFQYPQGLYYSPVSRSYFYFPISNLLGLWTLLYSHLRSFRKHKLTGQFLFPFLSLLQPTLVPMGHLSNNSHLHQV